ncbi:flavodoxin [Ramlibacter alkalitolerans]|uniref:Flavodoxin n=1 Tax=Ramlibacter alkalitolerans TaxID=2039631 RepID=A0ABS1JTS1_9BURK|nr:flavodoxin [Ramlibacter alkalitolerans]MBL0427634.1 flavodoxin [Ramlibacter alkalitolerans]
MDSMLVVVYSETGLARDVAAQLHAEHGWPVGEIHDLRSHPETPGVLRPLLDSLLHRGAPISYQGPDPGDFRTVVIVTPMLAGHVPAAMRAFLGHHREQLRRVAIISILKSDDAVSAVPEVAQLLGHAPIHNATLTAAELERGSVAAVREFGAFLQPRSTALQFPATGLSAA